jgi:hypothetical protein
MSISSFGIPFVSARTPPRPVKQALDSARTPPTSTFDARMKEESNGLASSTFGGTEHQRYALGSVQ